MEKRVFRTIVTITALSFIMGIASISVAQDTAKNDNKIQQDTTSQHRGEMHRMERMYHRGGIGMGGEILTQEQIEKLRDERNAFQTATRDLRMELKSKRLALASELAKKEPDAKTAKSLQKEISSLNAELAQKRIEHILAMKKIAPYGSTGRYLPGAEGTETDGGQRNT